MSLDGAGKVCLNPTRVLGIQIPRPVLHASVTNSASALAMVHTAASRNHCPSEASMLSASQRRSAWSSRFTWMCAGRDRLLSSLSHDDCRAWRPYGKALSPHNTQPSMRCRSRRRWEGVAVRDLSFETRAAFFSGVRDNKRKGALT